MPSEVIDDANLRETFDTSSLDADGDAVNLHRTCVVINGKPTGFSDVEAGRATYIGRGNAHYGLERHELCNPAPVAEHGRKDSLMLYAETLCTAVEERDHIRELVRSLHGEVLACWCSPLLCHGDVLALFMAYRYHVGLDLEQTESQIKARLNHEIDRLVKSGEANPSDYY